MGNASWPVLGCCTRHGERACSCCFDLPVAQADVEAVVDLLRRAEHAGVVPFGEARDTERHFRLFRPRVFTLRCMVGEVAEVSARARELVERFEARLTAAGSGQVGGEQGPVNGPCSGSAPQHGPSAGPCSHGLGSPAGPSPAEPDEQGPVAGPSKALSLVFAHDVVLLAEEGLNLALSRCRSTRPLAVEFRVWLAHDVVPRITRKYGILEPTFTGRWADLGGGRPEKKEEPS